MVDCMSLADQVLADLADPELKMPRKHVIASALLRVQLDGVSQIEKEQALIDHLTMKLKRAGMLETTNVS